MQFSTFFYHSNTAPFCLTFVNDLCGLVQIFIAEIDPEEYWIYNPDDVPSFVIPYAELVSSPFLFKVYVLSLLTTADPTRLSHHYVSNQTSWTSSIMDCQFCIETRKCIKGLRFDDHFTQTFGFDHYPSFISVSNPCNDVIKSQFLARFSSPDDWIVNCCTSPLTDQFISSVMPLFLERFTDYLEADLLNLEKNTSYIYTYKLFLDKLSMRILILDDIKSSILSFICKPVLNDPLQCSSFDEEYSYCDGDCM